MLYLKGGYYESIIYFILINLQFSIGCKESWTLISDSITKDTVIIFKNISKIDQNQYLSWTWIMPTSKVWRNTISITHLKDEMEGTISFNDNTKIFTDSFVLRWKFTNGTYTWQSNRQKVYEPKWKLIFCENLKWGFKAENGQWKLNIQIGNMSMEGNNEDTRSINEIGGHLRKKRSEDFEDTTIYPYANTSRPFNCFYEYFFGEEDRSTGHTDGIFTRFVKWVKRIGCSITGGCQEDSDLLPIQPPPPTIPPEPDNVSESFNDI